MVAETDVVETLSVIEIRGSINPWDFQSENFSREKLSCLVVGMVIFFFLKKLGDTEVSGTVSNKA